MDKSSLTINPAVTPVATGGAIGMLAGCIAAPEKYPLKKLLVADSDTFDELFPKKKMNALQLNSLEKLKQAAKEYLKSGKEERENVKLAAIEFNKKFKAIPINETLSQNLLNKKNYLKQVAEDNNFVLIRQYYTRTRELLLQDLDNSFMREYYNKIKEQLKLAKNNLKQPIEDYRNIVRETYTARLKNMKNLPNHGIEVKQAFEEMQKALAVKRTVNANKLYELVNRTELTKAYKSVMKFLPKARTRAAANGAILLSTLTALGIIFFNPSPHSKS